MPEGWAKSKERETKEKGSLLSVLNIVAVSCFPPEPRHSNNKQTLVLSYFSPVVVLVVRVLQN